MGLASFPQGASISRGGRAYHRRRRRGQLTSQFPITSIEDPIAEDDLSGWKRLTTPRGSADPTGRRRRLLH
ncbi:hypothetical protein ABTX15_32210 [Micromonospora sp. NPDC094482]|uniref:hypothetical protein n=1 Tax=Micromonospora sp. NPDC094482 TaxID=3155081 RepID=UPI00331BE4C5